MMLRFLTEPDVLIHDTISKSERLHSKYIGFLVCTNPCLAIPLAADSFSKTTMCGDAKSLSVLI